MSYNVESTTEYLPATVRFVCLCGHYFRMDHIQMVLDRDDGNSEIVCGSESIMVPMPAGDVIHKMQAIQRGVKKVYV